MTGDPVLEIASIAAGGAGVARHEGLVVFVPRTAPGDRVVARISQRGRFATGTVLAMQQEGADRVIPPCRHYTRDRCGGCQLQHLSYGAQLLAKQGIVSDAFARVARRPTTVEPVEPSTKEWRYRRKLTLAMRSTGEGWIAGLHPYDDPIGVFDLHDCPITDERVIDVWRAVLDASGFLPRAEMLRVAVRLTDHAASLTVEGGIRWGGEESASLLRAVPALESIWWTPPRGVRREVATRGSAHAAGASFVQVNAGVANTLREHVHAIVARVGPSTVIDAYAGDGATAVRIALGGARVIAIEADPDAAAECARLLPDGSRAIAALVEDAIAESLPADLVVLNPPRAGVHERVTAALSADPPSAIIYVSCDPATLARDVGRLPGFRIASVRPFDMFPQTAHVETVCELVRDAA